MRVALLLLLLAAAAARGEDEPEDGEAEDDGDSAPFMIVVEHPAPSQWRCGGSLVSLRTALTSAWCARGQGSGSARGLWALAAAATAAPTPTPAARRRIARVATARTTINGEGEEGDGTWGGVPYDVAVLELEFPFGPDAYARPILMATSSEECGAAGELCHVARALWRQDLSRATLRIEDAQLANDTTCSSVAAKWQAVRDQALCLTGPPLCSIPSSLEVSVQSDWGAGVVCGGKLCGVVSRSAGGQGVARGCGTTHAAQSVARWRRFLHCAHTLRTCGRGECAELCTERHLLDKEPSSETHQKSSPYTSLPPPLALTAVGSRVAGRSTVRPLAPPAAPHPTRTSWAVQALPDSPSASHPAGSTASLFEPNRPDFKAGEYGDNAAEYVAPLEEPAPPRSTSRAQPPAQPRAAFRQPLVTAAAAGNPPALRSADTALALRSSFFLIFIIYNILIYV